MDRTKLLQQQNLPENFLGMNDTDLSRWFMQPNLIFEVSL